MRGHDTRTPVATGTANPRFTALCPRVDSVLSQGERGTGRDGKARSHVTNATATATLQPPKHTAALARGGGQQRVATQTKYHRHTVCLNKQASALTTLGERRNKPTVLKPHTHSRVQKTHNKKKCSKNRRPRARARLVHQHRHPPHAVKPQSCSSQHSCHQAVRKARHTAGEMTTTHTPPVTLHERQSRGATTRTFMPAIHPTGWQPHGTAKGIQKT